MSADEIATLEWKEVVRSELGSAHDGDRDELFSRKAARHRPPAPAPAPAERKFASFFDIPVPRDE